MIAEETAAALEEIQSEVGRPKRYDETDKVLCVCLTNDRQELTERALAYFNRQTYPHRHILILDTGSEPFKLPPPEADEWSKLDYIRAVARVGQSIGQLRNFANSHAAALGCNIIAHWDSDDWSHPYRLAEQVRMLRQPGVQATGYSTLVFWNGKEARLYESRHAHPYAVGTSLCYWRRSWDRNKFQPIPNVRCGTGEDHAFQQGVELAALQGIRAMPTTHYYGSAHTQNTEPMMIARVHAANTMDYTAKFAEFRRVPEWDAYCAERM